MAASPWWFQSHSARFRASDRRDAFSSWRAFLGKGWNWLSTRIDPAKAIDPGGYISAAILLRMDSTSTDPIPKFRSTSASSFSAVLDTANSICSGVCSLVMKKRKSRQAFRHGRMDDRHDVDAGLEQIVAELCRAQRVADDNRHHGEADSNTRIQRGSRARSKNSFPLRCMRATRSGSRSIRSSEVYAAAASAGARPTL